jgi:hypothetical protein
VVKHCAKLAICVGRCRPTQARTVVNKGGHLVGLIIQVCARVQTGAASSVAIYFAAITGRDALLLALCKWVLRQRKPRPPSILPVPSGMEGSMKVAHYRSLSSLLNHNKNVPVRPH